MSKRLLLLAGLCTVLVTCGGNANNTKGSDGPVVQISGSERLRWDQPATDATELSTFRYHIWVDGVSSDADDVSCANSAGDDGFACTSTLPRMSGGMHTLELSAYIEGDSDRLGVRAMRVRVNTND